MPAWLPCTRRREAEFGLTYPLVSPTDGLGDPVDSTTFTAEPMSLPGGILSLSAAADDTETGLLWSNMVAPGSGNAGDMITAGVLRAFDALDLTNEVWNSDLAPDGVDAVGSFAKFNPPLVVNNKVYVANFCEDLGAVDLAPIETCR